MRTRVAAIAALIAVLGAAVVVVGSPNGHQISRKPADAIIQSVVPSADPIRADELVPVISRTPKQRWLIPATCPPPVPRIFSRAKRSLGSSSTVTQERFRCHSKRPRDRRRCVLAHSFVELLDLLGIPFGLLQSHPRHESLLHGIRWISACIAGCPHALVGRAPSVLQMAAVSASASALMARPISPGLAEVVSSAIWLKLWPTSSCGEKGRSAV